MLARLRAKEFHALARKRFLSWFPEGRDNLFAIDRHLIRTAVSQLKPAPATVQVVRTQLRRQDIMKNSQSLLQNLKTKTDSLKAAGTAGGAELVVIAGPPAAGKGTQCDKIKAKYGYVHISTGDILRENVKN
ncbi:unnamed protein product, partial [Prorocentrum cordatum]